jgi:siroheme synthase-like protein
VSLVPLAVHAENLTVLVAGGGRVGTFKTTTLLSCGARVRVVAPEMSAELERRAAGDDRLTLIHVRYSAEHLQGANLVIAATSSPEINQQVARDARALGRLVGVVDGSAEPDFHSMAVHRAGDLVIGVTATKVPGVARAVRDAIADRFDGRYEDAVMQLAALRGRLLETGGPDAWHAAAESLFGKGLCEAVESGRIAEQVTAWR